MGFMDKILDFLRLNDDDDDEYEFANEEYFVDDDEYEKVCYIFFYIYRVFCDSFSM
mgnify:CR=1 FL=1